MNPYLFGKVSALSKFAELSPLIKAVLEHAAIGGAAGGTMGGVTGAIAAPEGKRLQGAGQGTLAGGLAGAALGAGGRSWGPIKNTLQASPHLEAASRLGAGATALIPGGIAGAAAAPNEDTMLEKIKAKLGLG